MERGPLPRLDRRRLCRRRHRDHRRQGRPATSPRSRSSTTRWCTRATCSCRIDDGDYQLAVDCRQGQDRHPGRDDRRASAGRSTRRRGHRPGGRAGRLGRGADRRAPRPISSARRSNTTVRRSSPTTNFGSQQRLEQAAADRAAPPRRSRRPRPRKAPPRRRSPAPRPISTCCKAQQVEAERTRDELVTALAKAERDLVVHRDPRPVRRRGRQQGGRGRQYRRSRERGCWRWCRSTSVLCRRQFQGDPARRASSPGQKVDVAVDALDGRAIRRRRRRRSRPPRARSSRCCRPTTRPAISPRSCSASPVRIAVAAGGARRRRRCGRACRWSPPSTPATRAAPKPTLLGVLGIGAAAKARTPCGDAPPRPPSMTPRAGCARRGRPPRLRAAARRLHLHGVRHVHGDPGHPDRLGFAVADPGRPVGLARRDHLGPDRLSDRRSDHDPAVGLPVARASRPAYVRRLGGRLHADELHVLARDLDRQR